MLVLHRCTSDRNVIRVIANNANFR
jgi:hypothetical protein